MRVVNCLVCEGVGTLFDGREWCPSCHSWLYGASVLVHMAWPVMIALVLMIGFVTFLGLW